MLFGFSGKSCGKAPQSMRRVHASRALTQQLLEVVSPGRLTAEGHGHKDCAEELPVVNCHLTH